MCFAGLDLRGWCDGADAAGPALPGEGAILWVSTKGREAVLTLDLPGEGPGRGWAARRRLWARDLRPPLWEAGPARTACPPPCEALLLDQRSNN